MRSRVVAVLAFTLLCAVFVVDALTPQTLVVAILLDIPIVLAALTQSRRLTVALVVGALLADASAAFINAAREGYHWQPLGVGDRLLSMLSIVLVGYLSTAVQERAQRVGRLKAQEARARREATLAAVADRIRTSLSPGVVIRAVVREAPAVFEAATAAWYPARPADEVLAARRGANDVAVLDERPPPELLTLTHRVADAGVITLVLGNDPVGRFMLERLRARSAIAVPLADRNTRFGVLVVGCDADHPDDAVVAAGPAFVSIAVNALSQASLFAELAERNAALGERQDVIRDLVYALSHDVRTPLAALGMTLQQAADGAFGALPAEYASVLRDSLASIDDLRRLADTLLLVARFEAGEHRGSSELVDMDAVALEVGSELRAMAAARGVTVAVEPNARTPVRGARGDLRRALSNLVANAIEHSPREGTVRVRTLAQRDRIDTVVSDDGFGVAPDARGSLFQRFSAISRAGGGTGLGLYIVRRIAEESGGTVSFASNEPRGSVFTLSLPRARA